MKETVNFGFKKPESTDFVDVSVFGENFDKIDAELARKTIPIVLNQEIDLTQDVNSINVTEQVEALADRFAVDLKRGIPVSVTFTRDGIPITVLLENWFEVSPTAFHVSGFNPNQQNIALISRFDLSVHLGFNSELQYTAKVGGSGSGLTPEQAAQIQDNTDAIAALPIAVNADTGYTEIEKLPRATNIDNVLDGDVLTVTSTLQDGRTIPGTMTFDANGYPESYTEEGVACKFSFTGFEKPKTVELPVVELTGCVSGEDITDETIINTLNSLLQNNIAFVGKVDVSYLGTAYGVFSLVTNDEGTNFFMSMIAAFGVSFVYMDGKWMYSAEPFAVG